MRYIGIDPGKSGGIGWIGDDGYYESYPMPGTERDIYEVLEELAEDSVAIIEKVHSMPGQGVVSSFTFGQNYGFLRGCLISLKIPFTEVTPQTWMKEYGMKRGRKESKTKWKNNLKGLAQQMFPKQQMTLANCDAMLIANYCKNQN